MLSNLVCRGLDEALGRVADDFGLQITRYADDISMSADEFDPRCIGHLKRCVDAEIRAYDFTPNDDKFVVSAPGSRKVVLGLLVDGERPRLTRRFKSKLRQHIYYLGSRGPANHAETLGFRSTVGLRRHIEGLITYARDIDPTAAARFTAQLASVDWAL